MPTTRVSILIFSAFLLCLPVTVTAQTVAGAQSMPPVCGTPVASRLEIAWDASPDARTTGYAVYIGSQAQPGVYSQNLDVGNVRGYVYAAPDATPKCFVVAAYAPVVAPPPPPPPQPSTESAKGTVVLPGSGGRIVRADQSSLSFGAQIPTYPGNYAILLTASAGGTTDTGGFGKNLIYDALFGAPALAVYTTGSDNACYRFTTTWGHVSSAPCPLPSAPPPPPPPPPPPVTQPAAPTVSMVSASCTVTAPKPPDSTSGWRAQFRRNGVNVSSRDDFTPFSRTVTVTATTAGSTWDVVWTKSDGTTRTSLPLKVAAECR